MAKVSNVGTPRERLARLVTLLGRTRGHLGAAAAVALVVMGVSVLVALRTKGVWRSEATILYRDAVTTRDGEPASRRAARLGPKLKELVNARSRLATLVAELDLYPQKSGDSPVDAVLEMQKHIGFRASSSDTFVVSFAHDDPAIAQKVTARLAELVIEDYERDSMDTASLTRDLVHKELAQADRRVEEASRALATFLAKHPQFTWGTESPYATMPVPGLPLLAVPAVPGFPVAPGAPAKLAADPEAAALEQRLARVEAELGGPQAPAPAGVATPELADAERRKAAADAALRAAESALADKLREVTPAHPDAVAARGALAGARAQAASAVAEVARLRGAERPGAASEPPSAERRAELAKERAALRQRLSERRARGGGPPEPAPDAGGVRPADPPADVVELETEWHRLRLDLDQARERFRAVQADARSLTGSADDVRKKSQAEMLLLDPAYLPPRPEHGRGRVLAVGALLALMAGLGFAAARVLLDDTLHDEGDVEAVGGPEVLVAVPTLAVREPPRREVATVAEWAEYQGASGFDAEMAEPVPSGIHVRPIELRASEPHLEAAFATLVDGADPLGGRDAALRSGTRRVDRGARRASGVTALALAPRLVPLYPPLFGESEVEVVGADPDVGAGIEALASAGDPRPLAMLRVLRHRLDLRRGDGRLVVTVTSPGRGEGKTTLAARLALALAEADRATVALVEGHLAAPRLAAAIGLDLPADAGFTEQIRRRAAGRRAPWGVVRVTTSLSLLAEPEHAEPFPGALHSPLFAAALRALRSRYDYVVVDGPPVLGAGDANVLEELSDAMLVVVRAGVTQAASLARATHQLGDRRIVGVVLNDSRPTVA
jgi:Mrp family chromosome partitioning ATPase/uncharacterized protein involved in exopolysaccharide biosynthesis